LSNLSLPFGIMIPAARSAAGAPTR
jgi:hypothetical protein